MKFSNIKGIIYDLDGTVISTTNFHAKAWSETGKRFGINITRDFLTNQKGMTNEAATKIIIPNDEEKLQKFVKAKEEYVIENAGKVDIFEGFEETYKYLLSKDIKVWICTSAPKKFVEKVYKGIPELASFDNKTVWREMYSKGKPDAEPILYTLSKMNLINSEAYYIGDAYNDFLSASNAECGFIYFCSNESERDKRISRNTPSISNHKQLISLLNI